IGEICHESSDLVAIAARSEPEVGDRVGGSAHGVQLAIVAGEALADVAGIDASEPSPAHCEWPLVLEVAREREPGHLVNRAAHGLHRSHALLGDSCIDVPHTKAQGEPGQQTAVELELKAVALRLARVTCDEVAAQRKRYLLLNVPP